MKTLKLTLTIIMTFIFSIGYSQKGKISRADSDYDKYAYIKTTENLIESS